MRYLVWALRLLVFVAVLMFALKNTNPVAVTFYADYVVHDVPLIVVMLVVFVVGALFGLLLTVPAAMRRRREALRGLLLTVPAAMRRRREALRLRREVERLQAAASGTPPVVTPEAVAPMSPL
ncbi:putative membrane protein [Bordetella bronchiseptica MO211]|nr:putative membrane protein [Bordetella bronchiseptica MO211]